MSRELLLPDSGTLLPRRPGVIPEAVFLEMLGYPGGLDSVTELADDNPTSYDSAWYDLSSDVTTPDYPPADYPLPLKVIGEDPKDTLNSKALPRLRELFPAYYNRELARVKLSQLANPEIEVEIGPEEVFESEAHRLRIILDAADQAAKDGSEILMTFDNDKTLSRKPDASLHLGMLATHSEAWEALSDTEQRSAYHRMVVRDVEATVVSPAVVVAVEVLREKYGDRIRFGMVSSNVQEYLDILCVKLNELTDDAFDPNYMIGYDDGRFASDMKRERRMTRGDNKGDPKASPTLEELFSPDISPVYADVTRYVDFTDPEAEKISAQDLKPAIILRLKDEDPYRKLSVVHLDDMPSAMRSDVPGARYIEMPPEAWFKLIENGLF